MSTTSPIPPSIGRVVLLSMGSYEPGIYKGDVPAIVNGVNSNDNIDVTAFPRGGRPFAVIGVPYSEKLNEDQTTFHWMDYQLKVAQERDPVSGEPAT